MELYQLKYFLMAAKYENISKAAQELRTSQPSVSRAIHALEEELGIELLLRSGRNVSLTYEGQLFQEKLIPVLQELDTIEKDMIESERGRKEVIRLNMLSAATILPGVIREFKKQNPNVYFKIMERKEGTQWDFCVRSSLPDVAYNSAEKLLEEVAALRDYPEKYEALRTEADGLRKDAAAYVEFRNRIGNIECEAQQRAAKLEADTQAQLRRMAESFRAQYEALTGTFDAAAAHVTAELRKVEVNLTQLPRSLDGVGRELEQLDAILPEKAPQ